MRVIDTSAWIETIIDSPICDAIRGEVPPPDRLIVPTIVQLELAKWLDRETPDRKATVLDATRQRVVVPLDTKIALLPSEVAKRHKLAVADAIIYATALAYDADLLTCDVHFKDLPHVIYVPKVVA